MAVCKKIDCVIRRKDSRIQADAEKYEKKAIQNLIAVAERWEKSELVRRYVEDMIKEGKRSHFWSQWAESAIRII